MRKFEFPFDSYELGSDKPMSIELHPWGFARYRDLANHPIYYLNSIQYIGGSLYRAALGYEEIWDKEFENALMSALDAELFALAEQRKYYIEEMEVVRSFDLEGLWWRRKIKPELSFHSRVTERLEKGERLTARVNLLDSPYHVDFEIHSTGEVFTAKYSRYLQYKYGQCLRSLDHANPPPQSKPRGTNAKNGKRGEATSSQGVSCEISAWDLPDNVLDLRERIERLASLRKAHKKASTNLV